MNLKDIAFSDGCVVGTRSSLNEFVVVFKDWQEKLWELSFDNAIGVENLNVEGEELDGVVEEPPDEFVARARRIAKEPDASMTCYAFRSPWHDEPMLRVVAAGCQVHE